MGKVLCGDCLAILKNISSSSVGLVYLDPPFFTQKAHRLKTRDLTEEYQFDDKWDDLQEYLAFLRERLLEIRRVMDDRACMFFHCDRTASHHIRLLLDDVFGAERFLSEIIWSYRRWSNPRRALLSSHQTIYMYTKTENYRFNFLMQDYSETTNLDQILQKRERNTVGKTVYARTDDGEIILNGAKKGVPLSDTWEIPYLNPKARERTGYPTQKPQLLLERIINLASDPGDVVLDPFCGSGTTLVAATTLQRNFIGIDISEKAVQLAESRLKKPIKSESRLLQEGRAAYDELPEEVKSILTAFPIKFVHRNSGVDALYDEFVDGFPIVFRVQRKYESLSEAAIKLAKAGRKMNSRLMILLQTAAEEYAFFDLIPEDVTIMKSQQLLLQEVLQKLKESKS